MSTVDPTQVPALVTDTGYGIMMENYARDPMMWSELFDTVSITGTEYGFTEMSIAGATEPEETERGQDAPGRTMDEVYQWYCKVRKLQEKLVIPEEMWRGANAKGAIEEYVRSRVPGLASGFAAKKERMAAAMFNRGAITAGDTSAFIGSYVGHPDPNNGKIYDGKPWFAASGNGHPLGLATSVTKVNHDANALSSANLSSAYVLHVSTNAYSEANEFIGGNRPNTLLVPPDLEETADILLNSTLRPGTANNDANTFQSRFRRMSWSYLTDTNGWFLGTARNGLRAYDSGPPVIYVSEPDKDNGNITIRMTSYFGAVVTNWRPWSAHNTSTS